MHASNNIWQHLARAREAPISLEDPAALPACLEQLSRFRGREGWVVTASWMPPLDAANEMMEASHQAFRNQLQIVLA